ncbi:MAG: sigma-70 family RNA polymerase sigma factor [Saprospiraceae bacterium]
MLFKKNKEQSDADLLAHYLEKGRMDALGQLFDRYLEMLYGVCLKYLKSPEAAEDAVMSIFEQLPPKLKKHKVKDFRPWVYVLAKNHCLMELRKKKIIVPVAPELMQSEEVVHPIFESPNDQKEIQLQHLEHCMEELPPKQKFCVDLFYLQGLSYKEIAAQQTLAVGKVRSNIQNGRRNLKNCIEAKLEKENHEAE